MDDDEEDYTPSLVLEEDENEVGDYNEQEEDEQQDQFENNQNEEDLGVDPQLRAYLGKIFQKM
jgi:hypothetical protein